MLRRYRYLFIVLLSIVIPGGLLGQSNGVPKSVSTLFDDLPVHDASGNSVLHAKETAANKIRRNIRVKASLNTKTCFVGEPVLLTATLYSALDSRSAIAALPHLPGFLVTEMQLNNDTPRYQTIDGTAYRIFTIRKLQLLPVQEGKLTVDALVVNNTVKYTDDNNKEQTYAGTVQSEPVAVTVRPLPEKNKPAVFTGLIGAFTIKTSVSSPSVAAGTTDTLHIEIAGTGNFNDCALPDIAWPNGVEHFTPKEELLVDELNSFPAEGKKTINIPFVVAATGTVVLPEITIAYFDPARALYKTSSSEALSVTVLPAVKKRIPPPVDSFDTGSSEIHTVLWIGGLLMLLCVAVVIYFIKRQARKP